MKNDVLLVTGASGFVGKAVANRAAADGLRVRAAVRRRANFMASGIESVFVGDLTADTAWGAALDGVDTIVHCAARVHVMHDEATDALAEFRKVNVNGTLNLARQAAAAGVQRFIFLSSVKVNGEKGFYTEASPAAPEDAYGISKQEAEQGLRNISLETGMAVVIIRPPLVYGLGVRANFHALMCAVGRGTPLPFGSIRNRRSFVSLENLVDFICVCVHHPAAANETFFVSDGEDLSTAELVRSLANALNCPVRLIPIPPFLLMAAATLVGKRDMAQRLLGSLQIEITKSRRLLGWVPPISVSEGMARLVGRDASRKMNL